MEGEGRRRRRKRRRKGERRWKRMWRKKGKELLRASVEVVQSAFIEKGRIVIARGEREK
jgi:hypothetical protein